MSRQPERLLKVDMPHSLSHRADLLSSRRYVAGYAASGAFAVDSIWAGAGGSAAHRCLVVQLAGAAQSGRSGPHLLSLDWLAVAVRSPHLTIKF